MSYYVFYINQIHWLCFLTQIKDLERFSSMQKTLKNCNLRLSCFVFFQKQNIHLKNKAENTQVLCLYVELLHLFVVLTMLFSRHSNLM